MFYPTLHSDYSLKGMLRTWSVKQEPLGNKTSYQKIDWGPVLDLTIWFEIPLCSRDNTEIFKN